MYPPFLGASWVRVYDLRIVLLRISLKNQRFVKARELRVMPSKHHRAAERYNPQRVEQESVGESVWDELQVGVLP